VTFLLLLALVPVVHASGAAGPRVPSLHREGRWLVDDQGRVVVLHGVNAVWKRAPYVPPATAAGFTERDAQWIADQGFNTVRLGVIFAGVMPREGVVDQRYLDRIEKLVRMLAARKVWVLLDFHQDMYNERFGGEGFPDWAVHDDGLPTPVQLGFPANYFQPSTSRAFDNLYANADGVADHYATAWRAVAQRFRDVPYVMGYDLINEPWPGTQAATCANPVGCPAFEAQSLQPFYAKLVSAIRAVDRRHLIWVEPQVLFNFGGGSTLTGIDDPQVGFSFHEYCLTAALTHAQGGTAGPECHELGSLVFDNAAAAAEANGWTSLLTEFGASDDLADIADVTALADEHLVGWQYWHYKEWGDPTTESQESGGQGMFTNDADLSTLKQAKADILIRAYPRATAGTPVKWLPVGKGFYYWWLAKDGVTEIVLPRRQFPRGYIVAVKGGTVVSARGAEVLVVRTRKGAGAQVAVAPR
jgi:endoglycosylceramidase